MSIKILSINDLSDGDLGRLFFRAQQLSEKGKPIKRKGIVVTAFFEPSTRTKLSFTIAASKIGLKVLNFDEDYSSLKKNESMADTLRTLASLGIDLLVLRTNETLDKALLASLPFSIINGGDGENEHPTQALLDCFTLMQVWASDSFVGRKILIAGDLAHSRVARSNLMLMRRLGAELAVLEPSCFKKALEIDQSVLRFQSFDQLPDNFDAVMMLRIQKERLKEDLLINDQEYFLQYGLSKKRLKALGEQCLILHPGPMNIGIEIEDNVAYGTRSLIQQQVKNGVFMRGALIEHCLKGMEHGNYRLFGLK
jgi:aspartate carbamoyltransferase catalytic subunit